MQCSTRGKTISHSVLNQIAQFLVLHLYEQFSSFINICGHNFEKRKLKNVASSREVYGESNWHYIRT